MRSPLLGLAFTFVLAAFATLAGCTGPMPTGDSGPATKDAPTALPAAVDDGVVRVTLAHVFLMAAFGCHPDYRAVDYVRSTRVMTWPACSAPDAGSSSTGYAEITRELTIGEAALVEEALRAIDYDVSPSCEGYDGSEHYMTTYTSDGSSKSFAARDLNCYGRPRAPKIVAAFDLLQSFRR